MSGTLRASPRLLPPDMPLPLDLAEPLARAGDGLGIFGRHVRWYPEIPSTNDAAAVMAERGAGQGCVIVANAQSAGRGRHGRPWVSPPGAGLYVSTVLHPRERAIPLLTIAAGVAIVEGIQAATGLKSRVKWPNDVYVDDRKLAGILAEGGTSEASPRQYVVLGFGINLMPAAYPPEIARLATSLEYELGRPVDRGLLLIECLASLSARYADLQAGEAHRVTSAWRACAASSLGRRVQWSGAGTHIEGVAEDIDESGALVVRTGNGAVRIISGEVQWI